MSAKKAAGRIEYADPAELAAYLHKAEGTLANWRSQGKGPRYQLIGGEILYPWDGIEEWCQAQPSFPAGSASAA
jgi:Helix-turn-helix domain